MFSSACRHWPADVVGRELPRLVEPDLPGGEDEIAADDDGGVRRRRPRQTLGLNRVPHRSPHLSTCRGGQRLDDLSAAVQHDLVVHVRGRARMVGDDRDPVADLGRRRRSG